MNGYVLLVCGVSIFAVLHALSTFLTAIMLGAKPRSVDIGLAFRPLHSRVGETKVRLGPLPLVSQIGFGDLADGGGWQRLPWSHRLLIAMFGIVVPMVLAALALPQQAIAAVTQTWGELVSILVNFDAPLNVAAALENVSAAQGVVAALGLVVLKTAAVNLLPLPPFVGFNIVETVWQAVFSKPLPQAFTAWLLRATMFLFLVLFVVVVLRSLR